MEKKTIALMAVRATSAISGLLVSINAFWLANVANFTSGLVFQFMLAGFLLVFGIFLLKIIKIKWLISIISIAGLAFLSLTAFLYFSGKTDSVTYTEQAVIVLGAGVRGETVTKTLADRLDKAIEYHHKNPEAVIVVSGGQGDSETITEALTMERYLTMKDIPAKKILREERSTSTLENLVFSKELLDSRFSNYTVVIITNDFHAYRASLLAQKVGLSATRLSAKTDSRTIISSYLREDLAVLKTWVVGE